MTNEINPLPMLCEECGKPLKQDLEHYIKCMRIRGVQSLERWKHDTKEFYGSFLAAIMESDAVLAFCRNRPDDFFRFLRETCARIEDASEKFSSGRVDSVTVNYHSTPYKAQVQALSLGLRLKNLQLSLKDRDHKWIFKITCDSTTLCHADLSDYLDATPLPRRYSSF